MRHIRLRRRGANHYTDYTEKYLESAFAPFGWHLTLRPEQARWSCTIQWDDSPWLTLTADWLDALSEEQAEEAAEILAEAFKTKGEVTQEPPPKQYEFIVKYGFVNGPGAAEEPQFLQQGLPQLGWVTHSAAFIPGDTVLISYQNYGGIAKGLGIEILLHDPDVMLENIALSFYDWRKGKRGAMRTELELLPVVQREEEKTRLLIELPEFELPEGINPYSIKLRAKARQDQCSLREFYLRFSAAPESRIYDGVAVSVWPMANPDNVVKIRLNSASSFDWWR